MEGRKPLEFSENLSAGETLEDLLEVAGARGLTVVSTEDQGDITTQISRLADASAGGWYSRGRAEIVVQPGQRVDKQVNVLAHELAHHELGHERYQSALDREEKELQAEATAYVVLASRGLESDFSAAYICNWARQQPADKVRKMWDVISQAAKTILEDLDK